MRCSLKIDRRVVVGYFLLYGFGGYCTGDLQWGSVTNGTVLGPYTEAVSQMVPCWGLTLRQCHKWYRAGALHRGSVTNGTVLGPYTEAVSQMVPCWGLTLRQRHKWYRAGALH
jgi:hypothetical protein